MQFVGVLNIFKHSFSSILLVVLCISRSAGLSNDLVALELNVNKAEAIVGQLNTFTLYYSQIHQWKSIAEQFAISLNGNVTLVQNQIQTLLEQRMYSLDSFLYDNDTTAFDSYDALTLMIDSYYKLLENKNDDLNYFHTSKYNVVLSHNNTVMNKSTSHTLSNKIQRIKQLLTTQRTSKLPSFLRKSESYPHIIIYNTIGAQTGGTTAMQILYETLITLGYSVLLCNDENRYTEGCRQPNDNQLIITGEWCHEVLEEYTHTEVPKEYRSKMCSVTPPNNSTEFDDTLYCASVDGTVHADNIHAKLEFKFQGRGVQYVLGFHHNDDSCRGRVAIGDSHYINQLIGRKLLGGYYLGCPMTNTIKQAYLNLIRALETNDTTAVRVKKENLLVVDADFGRDYPPDTPMRFEVPLGWKVIYAEGIPASQMPLLLQRAKIVLDLGMPGPERLSGEAMMFGAIPVISCRWNGASTVDFPGVHRVDHFNGTDITHTLDYIAANYETELQSLHNIQFLDYILSLDNKLAHTADVVFGSSHLHFILIATSLQQEYILNFQILALLYLYPLCSIDAYVYDVYWYIRHHYLFYDILKSAGYIRFDPMNPREFVNYTNNVGKSYVNIKSVVVLKQQLNMLYSELISVYNDSNMTTLANNSVLNLIPSWEPMLILLPSGWVPGTASIVFEWINDMQINDVKIINTSSNAGGIDCSVHSDNINELCNINTSASATYHTMSNSYNTVLISPHVLVSSDLIQSILYRIEHSSSSGSDDVNTDMHTSYNTKQRSHQNEDLANVCSLYNHKSDNNSNNSDRIFYGIVKSVPWMTLKHFTASSACCRLYTTLYSIFRFMFMNWLGILNFFYRLACGKD